MVMCPKCGKVLGDGMRFCDNCGAQIPETAVCPNCGERVIPGYAFCQKCGTPVGQVPNPGVGYAPDPNAGYAPTPGTGYAPDPNAGYVPTPGTGYAPDPNAGYVPTPGTGYAPDPNAGYAPTPGTGYAPDPNAGYAPTPGTGYAPDPNAGYAPTPGTGYAPDPNAGYAPTPGTGYAPDPNAGYAAGYTDPAATAVKQKKGGIPKKALIFGGIGVAAVAVIVAVVALIVNLLGGGSSTSDKTYMFYLRDREIVYFDLKSGDKLEVTSRLLNGSISDSNLASGASTLGRYIAFNEDGSRIFYPDRTDFNNAEGITLYYRNMKKTDEEPVKIDSDITSYAINKAGTVVIYNKGSDGNLYRHDLTNKEKIASNVEAFDVSDDCARVLYLTEDGTIYQWSTGGDKTKIASDVYSVRYVSGDLSVIYYTKLDSTDTYTYSLYKQVEGSDEKVKIASDISRIGSIYESGELYYIKSEDVEINLMDYVNDDLAAADAAITEPVYPTSPTAPQSHYWYHRNSDNTYYYYESGYGYRYFTEAEYNAIIEQYNTDYAKYLEDLDKYHAAENAYWDDYYAYLDKVNRDSLRDSLKESTMELTKYTLYYYNGTEETVVTDALTSPGSVSYALDASTLLLSVYEQSEVKKVKFSEVSSIYDVRNKVDDALYSSSARYIAVKATLTLLDQPDASHFTISYDGAVIYFLDDIPEDGAKGELYKITIADGQVGRPELYDSDVSTNGMFFLADNRFVYYKDVDESNWKGDLYIDKAEIDYDTRLYSVSYTDNAVYYYTDWNYNKGYGTLKKYENGEKTKIADDVHSFVTTDDNDLLYLYDYSSNSYKGTLYRYNKGEAVKVDEDVMALIPVSGGRFKGYSGW